ncbi:MAG: M23 family metallopeptidase [Actinobacteria bacterium]|nr:M23 family metallopeptidase [Actinomycetota bacterium]
MAAAGPVLVTAGPAVVTAGPASAAGAGSAGTDYRAPVDSVRVLTPFSPPPDRYGPGHLGVDLAAPSGQAVLAAGDGVVRFAGQVAGRGVVVVLHPDGISTEYEPLKAGVTAGQQVRAGQRIGTVAASHRGCAPASCLHWGARRGENYLDPLSLLRPLGVVRLLPWE